MRSISVPIWEMQLLKSAVIGIVLMLAVGQSCMGIEAANCAKTADGVQNVRIHDIQAASHQSPLICHRVKDVPGIVISVQRDGFFMQDPEPDNDNATSEGIFVYTQDIPIVKAGDCTCVNGIVKEFRYTEDDLGITEIVADNNPAPNLSISAKVAPTIIGATGRIPPNSIIEDDAVGEINGQNNNTFDPEFDGLDFYESLEGMLVQINAPLIVGLPDRFGVMPMVDETGLEAATLSNHGGIVLSKGDFNPERIFVKFASRPPTINMGDRFDGPIVGVLTYRDANYRIEAGNAPNIIHNPLGKEITRTARPDELVVATFNVENLNPMSNKFSGLAHEIVDNLHSPDILALQEIQDDNGLVNDSAVDATQTFKRLIDTIMAIGGSEYKFFDIDPQSHQDGGAVNGSANIRIGFLYRTDRGLSFPAISGGNATAPENMTKGTDGLHLSINPGRIDPMNQSFKSSRKPLASEFMFRGAKLFVIANHFNSKLGDQPLFGNAQPPGANSEIQRHEQAQAVHDFVKKILDAEPNASVIVLGDFNDFQFSKTLEILKGDLLINAVDSLPLSDQYTTNFEGNSEVLDQILISKNLSNMTIEPDIVHINSGFADQASDHDPVLIRISFS
jgi:predicted extracellular nuclease